MEDTTAMPDPLPAGYALGHLVIDRELRPARYGRAYEATDQAAKLGVVVVVLAANARNTDGVRSFRAAFRRAFDSHRHVLEYGEWLGVPYAVMASGDGTESDADL